VRSILVVAGLVLVSCYPSFPDEVTCAAWCSNLDASCSDEFDDTPECLALCEADVFYEGSVSGEVGEYGTTSGNFLACRLEHAYRAGEAAEAPDQATACSAAATHGGDTCGSYQDVWCELGAAVCGPEAALLPDEPAFQLATPWRDGRDACLAMDVADVTAEQFEARAADLAEALVRATDGDWSGFSNCCQEGGTDVALGCGG